MNDNPTTKDRKSVDKARVASQAGYNEKKITTHNNSRDAGVLTQNKPDEVKTGVRKTVSPVKKESPKAASTSKKR